MHRMWHRPTTSTVRPWENGYSMISWNVPQQLPFRHEQKATASTSSTRHDDRKQTMKWNWGSLWLLAALVVALGVTVCDAQGPVGPPGPIAPSLGFIAEYEQLRKLWFFQMFPTM